MTVFGPDGRSWTISRRPASPALFAVLVPGGAWVVEATAEDDEVRRWAAGSRRAAGSLVTEVALAVRTGAPGPAGELPPDASAEDVEAALPRTDERLRRSTPDVR